MFEYRVRVRYADIDRMNVAYHSRYFEWFEAARTELLRRTGLDYKTVEQQGIMMPVIEAHCRYMRPVHYDEMLQIRTFIKSAGRTRLRIEYGVYGEEDTRKRADGYTVHCFLTSGGQVVRAPDPLYDILRTDQK